MTRKARNRKSAAYGDPIAFGGMSTFWTFTKVDKKYEWTYGKVTRLKRTK